MTKWRELQLNNDREIWDREKPIEGTFVRTDDNIGPNSSKMHVLKVDGNEVGLWGSTVLDDKLMGVYEGAYIKVEYEGKVKGKRGTEYHSFKVFIDEDNQGTDKSGYQKAKEAQEKLKDKVVPMPDEEEEPLEMPEGFLK